MSKKVSHKAFVDAIKAKGGVKYYDLGGGVTQGGLIGALTPQSQYQAQLAPTVQANYSPVINTASNQALAGNAQYQQNLNQQQALGQQLVNEGNGQGPNPAQAQLAQNTAANVAQQNSLAAGQRGGAANVGLLERQAAQQGAGAQQTAVGQQATLAAQQQLAAQQAAAQQQQNIASNIQGNQGVNTQLFGTGAGANNQQNATNVSNQAQMNNANVSTANANAQNANATSGGLLGGIGSAVGSFLGLAKGGEVPTANSAMQTYSNPSSTPVPTTNPIGPKSFAGQFLNQGQQDQFNGAQKLGSSLGSLATSLTGMLGPKQITDQNVIPVSAGDVPMQDGMATAAKGGKIPSKPVTAPMLAAKGTTVPGKAKVKGDSLKNDTVPALLSPGEVVIPKHVMESNDPVNNSARFVQAIMAKKKVRGR